MNPSAAYDIFISYSHVDMQFAVRLETALRKYRPPFGSHLEPKRLAVYRDESEASGTFLSEALGQAIAASRKLIVICSPSSHASRWVDDETALFISQHDIKNVIPVLVAGLPNDEAIRLGQEGNCAFPRSLIAASHDIPWSPDFRGWKQNSGPIAKVWPAWFHLLAAVYDVPRETIEQKERTRRIYQTAVGVVVSLGCVVAGWAYLQQRNDAISLDFANKADALQKKDLRRALEFAVKAVEASPSQRATEVLEQLLYKESPPLMRPSVMAVSSDGTKIAQASPFGSSVLYDILSQRQKRLCGFVHPVTSLFFSPDGSLLVAFSENDGRLQVFETTSSARRGTADLGHYLTELDITFLRDSKSAVITGFSITPQLRRLPSAELVKTLKESGSQSRVIYSPRHGIFATFAGELSLEEGVTLWDAASGNFIWSGLKDGIFDDVSFPTSGRQMLVHKQSAPPSFESYFMAAELGADRRPEQFQRIGLSDLNLASLSHEGARELGPTLMGESVARRALEAYPDIAKEYGRDAPTFSYVTMSPSGRTAFAELGFGAHSILLSLPSLQPLAVVNGIATNRPVYSVNGEILAIELRSKESPSSEGSKLAVWSSKEKRELWSAPHPSVDGYVFSPDGTRLIAWKRGVPDSTVWVYDANSGRKIAQLPHRNTKMRSGAAAVSELMSVLFVDNGGHTLISRAEHTTYVWNVDTATLRTSLNLLSEDEASRQAETQALSSVKRADVAGNIGRKHLNECPG